MREFLQGLFLGCFIMCVVLIVTTEGHCQAPQVRPYVQGGLSFNDSGEQTVSPDVQAGFDIESKYLISQTFVEYNEVRKTYDDTVDNKSGHKKAFGGDFQFRRRRNPWHFGVGGEFSQQSTTNYTKQSVFWTTGGGYDFADTRIDLVYFGPALNERTSYPDGHGCKCTNGVQAIRFLMYLPNPSTKHHVFFIVNLTPIWFHDTVTDPSDAKTSAQEESRHHVSATAKLELRYRF